MHSTYGATIELIKAWSKRDDNVKCCVAIGSQVREECAGDVWSDLDLMVLADDPPALLASPLTRS
jgi:predicted nucleotidyltransferase